MIRRRLLSEQRFGQPGLLYRLTHIRLSLSLLLALPVFTLLVWYIGIPIITHTRYLRAAGLDEPLTLELFHLHLHDRLTQDLRRARMPDALGKSTLPTYGLLLSNDKLAELDANVPPEEGRASYLDAMLTKGSDLYQVQVRYRGSKHWHWNNPQKSWKVRVKGEEVMFGGLPTFNFINTPDSVPFYEEMILDIAEQEGLLTPAYYPFRLLLNNAFMGVYFFEAQVDEGLLRQSDRLPGGLFSSAMPVPGEKTVYRPLFSTSDNWKKVASTPESPLTDQSELDAFLRAITSGTDREFADFARRSLAVDKFQLLDALDVVFGLNQRDFIENHKIYLDPARGRFEPVGTDFRGAEHDPVLNRTENPWLLRLKQLPSYVSERNRRVYELITGSCSARELRSRAERRIAQLEPDQIRDPYWDAYELLPPISAYAQQLVRPMTLDIQAERTDARLDEFSRRQAFLLSRVGAVEVTARLHPTLDEEPQTPTVARTQEPRTSRPARHLLDEPPPEVAILDVMVSGEAGIELHGITALWPESCENESWDLVADTDLDARFDLRQDTMLLEHQTRSQLARLEQKLFPGVILEPQLATAARGPVRTRPDPRRYRFFIRSASCSPTQVLLEATNLVTGAPFTLTSTLAEPLEPLPFIEPCNNTTFAAEPGRRSPHLWCLPHQVSETIELGPGRIELTESRFFAPHQTVVVRPGTTFALAEKASLVFEGRVVAEGRPDAPIRFVPSHRSWGGIVVRGPSSRGSRFQWVEIDSGSRPSFPLSRLSGTLSVVDTTNIRIDSTRIASSSGLSHALFAAYVDDLELTDLKVFRPATSGVELVFCTGSLNRSRIVGTGAAGLVLSGARFQVNQAEIIGSGGAGLLVGERSEVTVATSLIARSPEGIRLRNCSSLELSDTLLYRARVGLAVQPELRWYPGPSQVRSAELFAVLVDQATSVPPTVKLRHLGPIRTNLSPRSLPGLRQRLLEHSNWSDLDAMLEARKRTEGP